MRYNDAMREQEEDIQREKEAWREDKKISNAKGKAEKKRKNLKWTLV